MKNDPKKRAGLGQLRSKTAADPEKTAAGDGRKLFVIDADPKKTGSDPVSAADLAATVIAQTKKWIVDVVVGCNFCPFANI